MHAYSALGAVCNPYLATAQHCSYVSAWYVVRPLQQTPEGM